MLKDRHSYIRKKQYVQQTIQLGGGTEKVQVKIITHVLENIDFYFNYMRRDRLNKLEDIGFFIAIMFASIVIGFEIIRLISKLFM